MDKELDGVSRAARAANASDDQGARFAARRRVIKGCVGVPVVVTLANGSAASAASIYQCVANQEELNLPTDGDTPFIAAGDAEDCPNPDAFAEGVFDCGQDTAVRDSSVETAGTGEDQDPNLVLVNEDGDIDLQDGVPTVQSCYASITTNPSAGPQNDANNGILARISQALGLDIRN
ncbi:MAG: hypothetical protein PVF91_01555 [Chromatiales bacterium]|jgi:hypothetical protein